MADADDDDADDDNASFPSLPSCVLLEVLKKLNGRDLAVLSLSAKTFDLGIQPSTSSLAASSFSPSSSLASSLSANDDALSLTETAAFMALRAFAASVQTQIARLQNESWKLLWHTVCAVVQAVDTLHDDDKQRDRELSNHGLQNTDAKRQEVFANLPALSTGRHMDEVRKCAMWLCFEGVQVERKHLNDRKPWVKRAVKGYQEMLSRLQPHNMARAIPRVALAARRLAEEGMWEAEAELLLAVFPAIDVLGGDVAAIEARVHVSTFLIDRMYASTYVRRGNQRDSEDLVVSLICSSEAVHAARRSLASNTDDDDDDDDTGGAMNDASALNDECTGDKRDAGEAPTTLAPHHADKEERLAAALIAHARALTLTAQHIGLNAMPENMWPKIEPVVNIQHLFGAVAQQRSDSAQVASARFVEAHAVAESAMQIYRRKGNAHSLAVAKAVNAETNYCEASATVSQLRNAPVDVAIVMRILRLCARSIQGFREAIDEMTVGGQGESSDSAMAMKDLGKTYRFSSQLSTLLPLDARRTIFGDVDMDHESTRWLQRAKDVHVALKGERHPLARNAIRLGGEVNRQGDSGSDEESEGEGGDVPQQRLAREETGATMRSSTFARHQSRGLSAHHLDASSSPHRQHGDGRCTVQ